MEQMSIFEAAPKLKIKKPIRLIELFAGIGAQAKALENLGADFEHYRVCEFDKYAVKSYNAVHGTSWETSDITQIHATDLGIVDTDKFCYILTYSFPCTDLSLAGQQKGMSRGSGTRSGLLWEVERLILEMDELPQILLMENVPQVHGTKNKADFEEWIAFLAKMGYTSVWKDLNAKDFGIPQNRNRCFMVSFLGDFSYTFPNGFPLELRLKDMLEDAVDEKYCLSGETTKRLIDQLPDRERERERESWSMNRREMKCKTKTAMCLQARDFKGFGTGTQMQNGVVEPCGLAAEAASTGTAWIRYMNDEVKQVRLGNVYGEQFGGGFGGNIWDPRGIAPTLKTTSAASQQFVIVYESKED